MMKFNFFCISSLVIFSLIACKQPDVTESPLKMAGGKEPSGPIVLVTGEEEVSLDHTPKLTVSLQMKDCLGNGKWRDSRAGIVLRAGGISIAPRFKDAAESTQPDAKVFEPQLPADAADSTGQASGEFTWRIKRAHYSIEIIAYNTLTTTVESKIDKDFDFSTGNEVKLWVEGTWQNNLCRLAWKSQG